MNKINVLIVDDHPMMCDALRFAVENEPDMAVAGESHDGLGAVVLAKTLQPDVILMDYYLPDIDGLAA